MSVNELPSVSEASWQPVCAASELAPNLGVRALVNGEQVALFRVNDRIYGVSAIDPFCNAAVLSRGIIGDLKGQVVVASPIYKQHFDLQTGQCLEDTAARLKIYQVRENGDQIEVAVM